MKLKNLAALLTLAALPSTSFAASAMPLDSGCADQRASNVDGRTEESGPTSRCGIGLIIFGFPISIFGPRCPTSVFVYPAHATCSGAKLVGSQCGKDRDIPVMMKNCSCQSIDLAGFGFASPNCQCGDLAQMGTLEGFKTSMCQPSLPDLRIQRPRR